MMAETKSVALGLLDAIVAGDVGRIDALLDPACRWWVQGWGEFDKAAFLPNLIGTISRSTTREMKILFVTAEEDRVAVAAEGRFGFAEGDYCNTYHYLFTISDGRVIAGREYLDTVVATRFFAS